MMELFQIIRRSSNILKDVLFLYFLFSRTGKKQNQLRSIAGTLCLMLYFLLFLSEDGGLFSHALPRFLLRLISAFLYLMIAKGKKPLISLYLGASSAVMVTLVHNLFMTPLTRPIVTCTMAFTGTVMIDRILCMLIVLSISIAIYYLIYRIYPADQIETVSGIRAFMLIIAAVITLYLNDVLRNITDLGSVHVAYFSYFAIILQGSLLASCISMERAIVENNLKNEEQKRLISSEALLKLSDEQERNDEEIRSLRHDMKNHLFSISWLIENHDAEGALHYISDLTGKYDKAVYKVKTGNVVLDGILSSKINEAAQKHIAVSVIADLSNLNFVEDKDLCVIIGNAMDNALEAASAVKEEDCPYITIRGEQTGSIHMLSFENNYAGSREQNAQLPATTKQDAANHGLGLKNIRAAALNYDGDISVSVDNENHIFLLQIMLVDSEGITGA